MQILAVDPGPEKSAWVYLHRGHVCEYGYYDNDSLLSQIEETFDSHLLVIEDVVCYGMPVGKEVFEMCRWMGRFEQASGKPAVYISNRDVARQLCGSHKAKDPHMRQALIDRYGGKDEAIGTKKNPGPLYGMKVKDHVWSALGVGVAWLELRKDGGE